MRLFFFIHFWLVLGLEQNDVPLALDHHRLLILNYTTICTQWGTALRQLILLNEADNSPALNVAEHDVAPATAPTLLNVDTLSANQVTGQMDLSTSGSQHNKTSTSRFGPIQHL